MEQGSAPLGRYDERRMDSVRAQGHGVPTIGRGHHQAIREAIRGATRQGLLKGGLS